MNFNKRFFNLSIWLSLLFAYVFPYKINDSSIECGFPFRFWKIQIGMSTIPNSSLLNSTSLDLLILIINILILYLIISFSYKLYITKMNRNDENK